MYFYQCERCKHVIFSTKDEDLTCCQEKMTLLIPNESDGSHEKHVPIYHMKDDFFIISVGDIMHPMTEEHSILWVVLEVEDGYIYHSFENSREPVFTLQNIYNAKAIYAYCNLHGLWKKDIC